MGDYEFNRLHDIIAGRGDGERLGHKRTRENEMSDLYNNNYYYVLRLEIVLCSCILGVTSDTP